VKCVGTLPLLLLNINVLAHYHCVWHTEMCWHTAIAAVEHTAIAAAVFFQDNVRYPVWTWFLWY